MVSQKVDKFKSLEAIGNLCFKFMTVILFGFFESDIILNF